MAAHVQTISIFACDTISVVYDEENNCTTLYLGTITINVYPSDYNNAPPTKVIERTSKEAYDLRFEELIKMEHGHD